ncbi:MAG: LytTR family DNA-binding domain-containing protein [Eubacterium sp.]|nr:LytTR family DNA-binding domain-containing protein [Eubacterium sp.]
MMKITICDDSIKDLLTIEKLLLKYKTLYPDKDFEVDKMSDPSRLSHKISEGNLADIYILDMLMPRQTGIDLGNQLRTSDCENAIIYVTASDDYALDAYGVRAVRYLLKPIDEDKFFEALDYALSYMHSKTEPLYLLKTKAGFIQCAYSKIEYIENVNRRLAVHLPDGELLQSLFLRQSFEEEIHEIAKRKNFLQIHKFFLVNLDYVKQLTQDSVVMESGCLLPVSKAKSANVKREYLLFVSEKYR